jgi:endonuclease YncB( thermonuclease family)
VNRFKYLWVWTLLSLALFGCQTASRDDSSFEGRCIRVFDGDTIEVLRSDETVRVRLHGIDTPERTQPFSSVARKRTGNLVKDKIVRVEVKDRDRYERIVARVFIDKEDLSILLVREGLAWHYSYYSSDPRLAYYEFQARRMRLGLWQDRNPEPPWDFRRRQRAER